MSVFEIAIIILVTTGNDDAWLYCVSLSMIEVRGPAGEQAQYTDGRRAFNNGGNGFCTGHYYYFVFFFYRSSALTSQFIFNYLFIYYIFFSFAYSISLRSLL